MPLFNKSDFIIFPSDRSSKKYFAILKDDVNEEKPKRVYFGAIKPTGEPYYQYHDTTPLKSYKQYDHKDDERRKRYIARHKKDIKRGFNAGWLSFLFLWN